MHPFQRILATFLFLIPIGASAAPGWPEPPETQDAFADIQQVAATVNDPQPILVELRGKALLKRPRLRAEGGLKHGSARLRAAKDDIEAEHGRAAAAIEAVVQKHRGRGVLRKDIIRREFTKTFNGFAVRLTPREQSELRGNVDVLAIHPDVEVKAVLDESASLIGAPQYRASSGFDGAGVTVAVIDTGIDYLHADLGGCLGAACKVVGGYDFVNDDADPRDDNGHGTHVASIVAGTNPLLAGIAPGASLLAYKVLDASGSGFESAILDGIERTVDPNDDGDTTDHADALSMSLGGYGNADDPMSQAVDNATVAGVVAVVAAGNNYSYASINSPGTARTALTVGATDDDDAGAIFSSKGPAAPDRILKPEVSAPGVSICAARAEGTALGNQCNDSSHVQLSGTSMATPHVAGLVALLREARPSLSAAQVKSLVVNNALEIGLPVLEAGNGRIDVPASGAASTTIEPATISWGLDDLSQATWTAHQSLTIRNIGNTTRAYQVASASLPAGVQVVVTPASFSLAAGASRVVDVALSVNNAVTPNLQTGASAYDGRLVITSGAETQRVPFVFYKSSMLRLVFDQPPSSVTVHDRSSQRWRAFPDGLSTELLLPAGIYDVIVRFSDIQNSGDGVANEQEAYVVHEGINLVNFREETIASTEATNTIHFDPRDELGAPLLRGKQLFLLVHSSSLSTGVSRWAADGADTVRINSVGSSYHLDVGWSISRCGDGLQTNYPFVDSCTKNTLRDIDQFLISDTLLMPLPANVTIGNTAADLSGHTVSYDARGDEGNVGFCVWTIESGFASLRFLDGPGPSFRLFTTTVPGKPFPVFVRADVVRRSQCTPGLADCCLMDSAIVARSHTLQAAPTGPGLEHYAAGRSLLEPPFVTDTASTVALGLAPAHFWLQSDNSSSTFRLRSPLFASQTAIFRYPFLGQGMDAIRPGGTQQAAWSLKALTNGIVVSSGTISQSLSSPLDSLPAVALPGSGRYQVSIDSPEFFFGSSTLAGTVRTELTFDSRVTSDPNPPWLKSMAVSQAGERTWLVDAASPHQIDLEIRDDDTAFASSGVGTITIRYRSALGPVTTTPTALGSNRYRLTLASCVPGENPVVVTATDVAGNTLRQKFDPAYLCLGQCASGGCPATHGDGRIALGESCDDGNAAPGDGCSAAGLIENGFACWGEPSSCAASCGDGLPLGPEGCDDDNTVSGDGCDSNCTVTACGNGIQTAGEICEDGNLVSGDGCDSNCTATACGNGVIAGSEICDDGNMVSGDGCQSNCTLTACGNHIVNPGEVCDDGNLINGDGCDANCHSTGCGNGIVTGSETCDDGNFVSNDGCDANCRVTACGNAYLTIAEQCDDGNVVSNDGCDVNCTFTACGNGVVTGNETCDDGNVVSGDGCDKYCQIIVCGDGLLADGEECDDGNVEAGCCSPTCTIEPEFTICRPAIGPCDLTELCNGVTATCSNDARIPAGEPCEEAAGVCASRVCTSLGQCVDSDLGPCNDFNPCTVDSCDPTTGCTNETVPIDAGQCLSSGKSKLQIRDDEEDEQDTLRWDWLAGEMFGPHASGSPSDDTYFGLCIYDTTSTVPTLVSAAVIQPSSSLWDITHHSRWKYFDSDGEASGVQSIRIIPSDLDGRSKVKLKAGGALLPLPGPVDGSAYFRAEPEVLVQLVNDSGTCWMATFSGEQISRNSPTEFRAKTP